MRYLHVHVQDGARVTFVMLRFGQLVSNAAGFRAGDYYDCWAVICRNYCTALFAY